jgi:large subunit ribosomal protein L33
MAKKGNRILIRLRNKETGSFYTTTKNRINDKEKLKFKKFDSKLKKHVVFDEDKVK